MSIWHFVVVVVALVAFYANCSRRKCPKGTPTTAAGKRILCYQNFYANTTRRGTERERKERLGRAGRQYHRKNLLALEYGCRIAENRERNRGGKERRGQMEAEYNTAELGNEFLS